MTIEIFRKKLDGSDLPKWLKQALYEMADDNCLHIANSILHYVEELLQEIEELSDLWMEEN